MIINLFAYANILSRSLSYTYLETNFTVLSYSNNLNVLLSNLLALKHQRLELEPH